MFLLYFYIKRKLYNILTAQLANTQAALDAIESNYLELKQYTGKAQLKNDFERKINYSIIKQVILSKILQIKETDQQKPFVDLVVKDCLLHPVSLEESTIIFSTLKEDIENYFADQIKNNKIEIECNSNDNNITMPFNQEFFYQIIFSLLSNRIKACSISPLTSLNMNFEQNTKSLKITIINYGMNVSLNKIDEYISISQFTNFLILPWSLLEKSLQNYNYQYYF